MRKVPEKEALIEIYSERYDALLEAGAIESSSGGYNRLKAEGRFRVYCCQRVWSSMRFSETDRLLQFAKAISATSDDNLSLDDLDMAGAFEQYKIHPRNTVSHNLYATKPRSRKDYSGLPCPTCGIILEYYKYKHCDACRAKAREIINSAN